MANPFVTRLIQVQYGTRTIGGTTSILIIDKYRQQQVYHPDRRTARASFSCRFVVTSPQSGGDSTFKTLLDAIEADLTKPRQKLTVWTNQVLNVVVETWDPSLLTNITGFNQKPTLTKPGHKLDGRLSRVYDWQFECDIPANLTGQNGRLDSTVNLAVEPGGRRRLDLEGVYTALGTNNARQQYTASIGTPAYNGGVGTGYVGTLTTGFGGSWELVNTPTARADDVDGHLAFSLTYREVLEAESITLLHDPDLTDQVFKIERRRIAPGDTMTGVPTATAPIQGTATSNTASNVALGFQTINVNAFTAFSGGGSLASGSNQTGSGQSTSGAAQPLRLQEVSVDYSVWVPNESIDLVEKWISAIRPWIVQRSTQVSGLGQYAITVDDPHFDYPNRQIQARMVFVGPNGSTLLEQTIRTEDTDDTGTTLVACWSGNPYDKFVFPGPASKVRVITTNTRYIGSPVNPPVNNGGNGFTLMTRSVSNLPLTLGLPGAQMQVTQTTVTETFAYATTPPTPQSGGGTNGQTGIRGQSSGGGYSGNRPQQGGGSLAVAASGAAGGG